MNNPHYVGVRNTPFLKRKAIRIIPPGLSQKLEIRRRVSQEWDAASSQFTEVFGSSPTDTTDMDLERPPSSIAVGTPDQRPPSSLLSNPSPSQMTTSTQDTDNRRADQAINAQVARVYEQQEMSDGEYVESSSHLDDYETISTSIATSGTSRTAASTPILIGRFTSINEANRKRRSPTREHGGALNERTANDEQPAVNNRSTADRNPVSPNVGRQVKTPRTKPRRTSTGAASEPPRPTVANTRRPVAMPTRPAPPRADNRPKQSNHNTAQQGAPTMRCPSSADAQPEPSRRRPAERMSTPEPVSEVHHKRRMTDTGATRPKSTPAMPPHSRSDLPLRTEYRQRFDSATVDDDMSDAETEVDEDDMDEDDADSMDLDSTQASMSATIQSAHPTVESQSPRQSMRRQDSHPARVREGIIRSGTWSSSQESMPSFGSLRVERMSTADLKARLKVKKLEKIEIEIAIIKDELKRRVAGGESSS